jgi:hypothetical protein
MLMHARRSWISSFDHKEIPMKRLAKIAVSAALLSAAVAAYAGTRSQLFVQVDTTSRYAYGAMTDARGSSDPYQQISCYTNSSVGSCYFVNSVGTGGSCYTYNQTLIQQIREIGDESYVYAQWNADGTCSYILVQNMSWVKPAAVSGF